MLEVPLAGWHRAALAAVVLGKALARYEAGPKCQAEHALWAIVASQWMAAGGAGALKLANAGERPGGACEARRTQSGG